MRKNKMKEIPRNTVYCYSPYTGKLCPYFTYKKSDYGFKIKGEHKEDRQYCKYLHKYLQVQDEVKNCGIGEDELFPFKAEVIDET